MRTIDRAARGGATAFVWIALVKIGLVAGAALGASVDLIVP
jgi:hypothetical protein